jgi:hypothetical protein
VSQVLLIMPAGSGSEKFEPVDEQVSGNGDLAKRYRNCVMSGRAS